MDVGGVRIRDTRGVDAPEDSAVMDIAEEMYRGRMIDHGVHTLSQVNSSLLATGTNVHHIGHPPTTTTSSCALIPSSQRDRCLLDRKVGQYEYSLSDKTRALRMNPMHKYSSQRRTWSDSSVSLQALLAKRRHIQTKSRMRAVTNGR